MKMILPQLTDSGLSNAVRHPSGLQFLNGASPLHFGNAVKTEVRIPSVINEQTGLNRTKQRLTCVILAELVDRFASHVGWIETQDPFTVHNFKCFVEFVPSPPSPA